MVVESSVGRITVWGRVEVRPTADRPTVPATPVPSPATRPLRADFPRGIVAIKSSRLCVLTEIPGTAACTLERWGIQSRTHPGAAPAEGSARVERGVLCGRVGEGLIAELLVPEQATGCGAGAHPVLEGDLAIDQGPAVTLRTLHATPLIGR